MRGTPETAGRDVADETAKVAWIFLCPNPTCDTQLVVLSEQAGQPVECPTCGFRFTAPESVAPEVAAQATAVRPSTKEAKAASALGSLAAKDAGKGPGSGAGGPSSERRSGQDRRGSAAAAAAVSAPASAAAAARSAPVSTLAAPRRGKSADLIITWVVAAVVSAGIVAGALVVEVPALALASLVFVGLAILRTAAVVSRKGPASP
jgi:hypothetical protein